MEGGLDYFFHVDSFGSYNPPSNLKLFLVGYLNIVSACKFTALRILAPKI